MKMKNKTITKYVIRIARKLLKTFYYLDLRTTASARELYKLLYKKFPNAYKEISDSKMHPVTVDMVRKLRQLNAANYIEYKRNTHDCENYAKEFNGIISFLYGNIAFGLVHVKVKGGGAHALNCFITPENEFWYFEPQNNRIFQTTNRYKPYLIII